MLLQTVFTLWGTDVTGLEVLAFCLSLGMVVGNLRVKVWAWPLAILSSACYAVLFAHSKLYGQAALQGVFIGVSFWGWIQWARQRAGDQTPQPVSWMSSRQRWTAAAATLVAWPLLALVLMHTTDTELPFADALPTVASVTGQILLARKRVENWLVWLAVNLFSVGLFAVQSLGLTALLYALFAVLSALGAREWQKLAREHG